MNKLLLSCAFFSISFAFAQNSIVSKITSINDILIGSSANGYTSQGFRSALDCNPQINTVTFIHRADPSAGIGNNSGELFFDISKNGGATWNNNHGPLYTNASGNNSARLPNAVIYNPVGNTNPNNAYLTYYTPLSQNNTWFADAFGTGSIGTSLNATQTINTHPYPDGTDLSFPDAMIMTQQGKAFVCDARLSLGNFQSYDGTLQLRHGLWNGINDMNYSTLFLPIPVDHDNNGNANYAGKCGVAFANNGLTGYAWINGHYNFNNLAPDSAYNLGIVKTINGGQTWSNVKYITFNGTGSGTINNLLGGTGNGIYSTWTESDGTVDTNGNLHIVCPIAPLASAFSINIAPGTWGLFDVYTTDGGITWKAQLLDKPQTFEAIFPGTTSFISETNRAQVAKTWNADKLFFGWMDTDTLAFGTYDNLNPDIHLKAYNVNTGLWTATSNVTATLPLTTGECTFLNIAPYVLGTTGTYTVPCTYTKILSLVELPVEHHYLDGIQIMDGNFTITGNPATLNSFIVGLNEIDASEINSINLYPNPATDHASLLIDLKKTAGVIVEVKNILGETIFIKNFGELGFGANLVKLNTRHFANGIYTVCIQVNEKIIAKKLAVYR